MRYFNVLLFLLPVLVISCSPEATPKVMEESPIDVANLRFSRSIYPESRFEVIPKDSLLNNAIGGLSINKVLPETWRRHRVPTYVIERDLLLKFTLVNTSDSIQHLYF